MTTTPPDVRIAAARLIERTCVSRGLPSTVSDPAALARLAAFLFPREAATSVKSGPRNVGICHAGDDPRRNGSGEGAKPADALGAAS